MIDTSNGTLVMCHHNCYDHDHHQQNPADDQDHQHNYHNHNHNHHHGCNNQQSTRLDQHKQPNVQQARHVSCLRTITTTTCYSRPSMSSVPQMLLLSLLLYLTTLTAISIAYNLDTNIALLKQGPKNSYFGYSIAQHATFDGPNASTSSFRSFVIIGAPRADAQPGSSSAGARQPGAVYRCEFASSLCSQIELDSTLPSRVLPPASTRYIQATNAVQSTSGATNGQLSGNNNNNINKLNPLLPLSGQLFSANMQPSIQRDNQWLGVSVKSQGPNGYAVACAHRYVLKGDDYRWGQGICYSLKPNLTQHNTWEPCLNRPVNRAHEEYGYCQAGISSDVSETNDIVVGTPGPYTWRGTVFTNSIQSSIRDDRTWYMTPVLEKESPVDKYSYLGMSVVSGKFLGNKQIYYVSGAPRANRTGQVLFMTKQSGAPRQSTFRTDLIISGEQLASSFGYTLAKLDCDGDGQLDLAVGAPFYYSGKTEGGAVYVYTHLASTGSGNARSIKHVKLTGKPESRFGFALSSCGDLNKDKYDDLAVGAPYEDAGGAVYIYLGSPQGIKTTPSQIIRPSDLNMNIQTFGYSLSGGLDMDRNQYPDLAIGAYASDLVVILKARPIIEIITKIDGNITRIDPNKATCDGEKSAIPCFKFHACFELDPSALGEAYTAGSIRLKYKIEAETFTGQKYYRVRFDGADNSETPNVIEREISIDEPYRSALKLKTKRCHAQKVYLIDKSDIQTPIAFKLSYQLVPSSSNELSSASSSRLSDEMAANLAPLPILNQEEAQRIFSARFLKDCGSNDICESHLEVDGQLHLPRDPGNPEVNPAPNTYYLGDEQLNVTVRVANKGEPAYDADLYVSHPMSLSYVGMKPIKTTTGPIECAPLNKSMVKCELGNPMLRGLAELQLRFNSFNIGDDESSITFGLNVTTTSVNAPASRTLMNLSASIVRRAELELRGSAEPDHIFYGGDSRPESAIVYQEEIGNAVTHTYVLTNYGPWKTRKVEVLVTWPFEIESASKDKPRRLLYLTETPKLYGNGYCEVLPGQVNPLKLPSRADVEMSAAARSMESARQKAAAPVRYRRSTPAPMPEPSAVFEEMTEETKAQYIVSVDCEKTNSAKCFRFSCYVLDLKPSQSAVIKIHARVWNSTLNENFSYGVGQLNILSRARVRLDDSVDLRQRKDNDFASARTRAHPVNPILPIHDAPLWVVIGSVIIGILLLCLLVYILYRGGFFERTKPVYRPADTEDRGFDERFA